MSNNHGELVPWIFISSSLLIYFMAAFMLYRRWKTKNYLILLSTTGCTFVVYTISLLLHLFQSSKPENLIFLPLLIVSGVMVLAGTYHFLTPKNKKEFAWLAAITGGLLLLCTISIFMKGSLLSVIVLFLAVLGYHGVFVIRFLPFLHKKMYFHTGIIAHTVAVLFLVIYSISHSSAVMIVCLLSQAVFFVVMLLAFFDRILDLVHIALQHSVTDGLTGLYNKTYFISKVRESLKTSKKSAVVFSDIDNFKKLNDTQGHHVGDQILKLVGTIMKEVFDTNGIVGRYGGEEMVALVTNPRADCGHLAETFRSRVEEESKGISPVTVSVGYSLYHEEIDNELTYIKKADDAMYVAKDRGKNQVIPYYPKGDKKPKVSDSVPALIVEDSIPVVSSGILDRIPDKRMEAEEVTPFEEELLPDPIPKMEKQSLPDVPADPPVSIEAVITLEKDPLPKPISKMGKQSLPDVPADPPDSKNKPVHEEIIKEVPLVDHVKVKKSAPGLKAKEIRNGESAFRPKFEHHIPKVASVPRLKPERKDPENREPIRKQIEEEKSKSWYAEGERKKGVSTTLLPEEEEELERILEENYRMLYGDRDPNAAETSEPDAEEKTLKQAIDPDPELEEAKGMNASGAFVNPFKKKHESDSN